MSARPWLLVAPTFLALACQRPSGDSRPPSPAAAPSTSPSTSTSTSTSMAPPAAASLAPVTTTSVLSSDDLRLLQAKYLERLRALHPLAAKACALPADAVGRADRPFPAALAAALAKEGDVVEAEIECKGDDHYFVTWRGRFEAPHSDVGGSGLPLDDGGKLWVQRPSSWDEAPDVVDLGLSLGGTRLGLAIRSSVVAPFAAEGGTAERIARARGLMRAFEARANGLFAAVAAGCDDAAIDKLPEATLAPLRADASVLQVQLSCFDHERSADVYTLYRSSALEKIDRGGGLVRDGVHAADGTMYAFQETSFRVRDAIELEVRRRSPRGSVRLTFALRATAK